MGEVLVLAVDAPQPVVAFAVKVDEVSHPSAEILKGRGFQFLVGQEAFKFKLIRIKDNELLLAGLTVVLDHLLNERGQFLQERLVAVNSREE